MNRKKLVTEGAQLGCLAESDLKFMNFVITNHRWGLLPDWSVWREFTEVGESPHKLIKKFPAQR